jgi:hypothetical protein
MTVSSRVARRTTLVVVTGLTWILFVIVLILGPNGADQSRSFWNVAYGYSGIEAERYATIEEMADAADAIVLGQIVGVERGRTWVAEVADDGAVASVMYADVEIRIEELVAGEVIQPGTSVVVEVMVHGDEGFAELARSLPDPRALFFLREKSGALERLDAPPAEVESAIGLYRFVNSSGAIYDRGGVAWIPATEEPLIAAWDGKPFGEVLDAAAD